MKRFSWIAILAVGVALAGCARTSAPAPDDLLQSNRPASAFPPLALAEAEQRLSMASGIRVEAVQVNVPEKLLVSEANGYYPRGDIVWRGDPPGDRHMQVKAIFETAAAQGTQGLDIGQPVYVQIDVTRFHSVSEKTRYTVGGVHSIRFDLSVWSATTGERIGGPHRVKADLKAFGGQKALEAERQGLTQKSRITDHLSEVIAANLGGTVPPDAPVVAQGPDAPSGI